MRPADLIRTLPVDIRTRFEHDLARARFEPEVAKNHLRDALTAIDEAARTNLFVNVRLAHALANRLALMLDKAALLAPEYQKLVAAAVDYYVDPTDAADDLVDAYGFDDDAEVVHLVAEALRDAPAPRPAA